MALQFTSIIFLITVLLIELAKANSNCFGPVCIPDSYDKTILPFHNETNYINVGFSYIRILQVDDEESTISLRLTLDMDWMDPRLNVEQSHHPDDFSIGNYTISRLNYAIEDKIWIPSPTIIDLKSIKTTDGWFYLINKSMLTRLSELEIQLYCSMVFDDYPLDSQTCYFKMMCVDYIDDKSIFKTTTIKSIEESPSNRQLHFKKLDVLDYHVEFYHLTKKHSVYESKGLNRTIVGFEIKLLRKYGKYIIYYYIPSGLIAIISCVSILYDLIFFCIKFVNIHSILICRLVSLSVQIILEE